MPDLDSQKPDLTQDKNILLRHQVRWVLLLRVVLYSTLLGVSSLLQLSKTELNIPPFYQILTFDGAILLYSILSELVLRTLRHYRRFVYIQIFSDTIFTSFIVYFTGGSQSILAILYFLPIISGGILLLTRGGLASAAAATICYGGVLFAGHWPRLAHLPAPLRPLWHDHINVLLHSLSIYGLSFFLTGMLGAFLSGRFKRTEAELNQTTRDLGRLNLLYKQIFDDINSGIITVDEKDRITSFNQASESITGFKQHEVQGINIKEIFPDLDQSRDSLDRPIASLTRKDRKSIQVGYSRARLHMPDNCDDCKLYTIQDLSKIKEMEDKVQQSEKMAAIGEIAAGIAHEFRNPLAAISGAAQVLNQNEYHSDTDSRLLNIILRETTRLEKNILDFLQFSKPAHPEKTWLSLNAIIEDSLAVIKQDQEFKSGCHIETRLPKNLDCWADQHQFKQIIINLAHNACQALGDKGGQVTVTAREVTEKTGKEQTVLSIADNGQGILPQDMSSIFEPFFTTRENGTGLGLAIVKKIIDSHEGQIAIESRPGQGTVFTIRLPLPP